MAIVKGLIFNWAAGDPTTGLTLSADGGASAQSTSAGIVLNTTSGGTTYIKLGSSVLSAATPCGIEVSFNAQCNAANTHFSLSLPMVRNGSTYWDGQQMIVGINGDSAGATSGKVSFQNTLGTYSTFSTEIPFQGEHTWIIDSPSAPTATVGTIFRVDDAKLNRSSQGATSSVTSGGTTPLIMQSNNANSIITIKSIKLYAWQTVKYITEMDISGENYKIQDGTINISPISGANYKLIFGGNS